MRAPTLLLLVAACGSDPPVEVQLSLGPRYEVLGVARALPDGVTPESLAPLSFRYEMLASSGGRIAGKLVSATGAESAIAGDLDPKSGDFSVEPLSFALTGTAPANVVELGGRGFDGTPSDGVVDDMSGYLRLEWPGGARALQAYTIAASPAANAPSAPDVSKIMAARTGLGRARVAGDAGAILPRSAVEIFVHRLALEPPKMSLVTSADDGAFTADIDASEGDALLIRARNVGIAGPAAFVGVSGD